jgi:hypothetical protein
MKKRLVCALTAWAFGVALTLSGALVFGQELPPVPPEGAPPAEVGGPPPAAPPTSPAAATAPPAAAGETRAALVTLRRGGVEVEGDVVVTVTSNADGKPVYFTPNVYYGVTDDLTLGIAENTAADIFPTIGGGFCFGANSCSARFNNLSFDGLFSFARSADADVAFHGGIDFVELSPDFVTAARVGVKAKLVGGPIDVLFDPSFDILLNQRDRPFAKEFLQIPVRLGFQLVSQLDLGVSAALLGPLQAEFGSFGALYTIPVGVSAVLAIGQQVALRAQFAFDNLAGKNHTTDSRTLSVGAVFNL